MIVWIFICLIYILFLIIDLPPVFQSKNKKVVMIYIVLMITAFTMTVANQAGVKMPSPSHFIKSIVDRIIGA